MWGACKVSGADPNKVVRTFNGAPISAAVNSLPAGESQLYCGTDGKRSSLSRESTEASGRICPSHGILPTTTKTSRGWLAPLLRSDTRSGVRRIETTSFRRPLRSHGHDPTEEWDRTIPAFRQVCRRVHRSSARVRQTNRGYQCAAGCASWWYASRCMSSKCMPLVSWTHRHTKNPESTAHTA